MIQDGKRHTMCQNMRQKMDVFTVLDMGIRLYVLRRTAAFRVGVCPIFARC